MIACLDAAYSRDAAAAACVLARAWTDAGPVLEVVRRVPAAAPYEPGRFYLRELPCLLAVLGDLAPAPRVIVVDGYVWLAGSRPGLGARLRNALGGTVTVVGVAKTPFRGAPAVPVLRGSSRSPLYVSAVGMAAEEAAAHVREMHGRFRIPTLLARADRLSRRERPDAAWRG
ncbi:MAG TPA: endonuclease V [Thermoanaerobaculaceae bacterium]|nr:endonuclease V [Thermoanaerobaculaceae bacterium]